MAAQYPNELEVQKLNHLQKAFMECKQAYVNANSRLYSLQDTIPKDQLRNELQTAKNSFNVAEQEYRSFVFEMMRKYNLGSL